MPTKRPAKERPIRGIKRMLSVPNVVFAVPAKSETTQGRFHITTIPEDEVDSKGMGSRKMSAVSFKAVNETRKLPDAEVNVEMEGDETQKLV